MIQDPLALLAFMFLTIAFARFLEQRFVIVQKISSAVVCTLLGILLANIGILPHGSEVHDGVYRFAVPYAIVLVIVSSRFGDLRKAGARLVICFVIAGAGTFIGAFVSSLLFQSALGEETWKLGGTFAGAFWGGGMNFAAVGQGLEMSPSLFSAAFVVDNLSTVPWMLAQVGLFTLLAPYYRRFARFETGEEQASPDAPNEQAQKWTRANMNLWDLSILSSLPLAALWLAGQLGPYIPWFPEVLWLTTIALVLAQLPFIQRLKGSAMLSYFALHLFFIVIGATSNVREVLNAGPSLFLYMLLIIAIHGVVVYGLGWLARFDLPTLTIASQAAVGGPGSALALGMAMKWHDLVTPGIIVGIFGYAVGNYLGFATAHLIQLVQ